MSQAVQPNPAVRKAIGALLLVSVLLGTWSIYVKSTNPSPPSWIDLPFGLLLTALGLRFWVMPDEMLSTSVRRAFAIVAFAIGASYFIRFFV